jgi:hypothetical protein
LKPAGVTPSLHSPLQIPQDLVGFRERAALGSENRSDVRTESTKSCVVTVCEEIDVQIRTSALEPPKGVQRNKDISKGAHAHGENRALPIVGGPRPLGPSVR